MSSRPGREWNSVVAAAPPPVSKPPPTSKRPSLQLPPRQASSSAPTIPCRYTKSEMLAMYTPTDRPPADYQFSLPVVSSECQAPVNAEPPSATERDILESGTWYMPSARTNPTSTSLKPGRNSAGRPPRTSAFSRTRPTAADDTAPSTSDYRPTRFNWRHDSHNAPGNNTETDASEARRGSFAEKSSRAGIGRSDAALSWRRGEDDEQPITERTESDPTPVPEASAWRSPTVQSRRHSAVEPSRKILESQPEAPDEGLVQQMSRLEPVSRDSWWYQDPSGTIRGPFSSDEMRDWYQQNYFQLTLPVRCHPDLPFTPLGALFLQGDPAFLDHVPMVMAAPVESRRPMPPPPAAPTYLPVHPLQQRVMPMFQPQPPPFHHPSFVPAAHPESMFRSTMPFANTPLGAPVLDQPMDTWNSRQAPNPEVIRQATPWMPFSSAAPIASQLSAVGDHRLEPRLSEPTVSIPEPLPAAPSLHSSAPQSLPVQDPISHAPITVAPSADPQPSGEPETVSESKPKMEPVEEAVCPPPDDSYPDNAPADNAASDTSTTSSQSAPAESPPATSPPLQVNGWITSPLSTAGSVKSLLEIQREEEEAHEASLLALKKAQQEAQAEAQALAEPVSNPTSPWGSAAAPPTRRSLLEIQKQEEIMQMSRPSQRPAASSWTAKVAPAASSWGIAPKPAALSMRQIQEEEQRVLCQQKEPIPQPSSSARGTTVPGSVWARPSSAINAAVSRPAPVISNSSVAPASSRLKQQQSESESDDEPFWNDSSTKSSKSDSSARNDFGGPVMSAEFREWCKAQLAELSSDCDVSLAEFLLTLESAEAIREYIYEYLGRSSKAEAFATGFLQHKDFDDSKHVVQSTRLHSSSSEKVVNNMSEDLSKKKKNRRRRKKKSEYP